MGTIGYVVELAKSNRAACKVCKGKIDKDLQAKVMEAGLPAKTVESRAKSWSNPSPTTYDTLLQLNLEDLVRNTGGAAAQRAQRQQQDQRERKISLQRIIPRRLCRFPRKVGGGSITRIDAMPAYFSNAA